MLWWYWSTKYGSVKSTRKCLILKNWRFNLDKVVRKSEIGGSSLYVVSGFTIWILKGFCPSWIQAGAWEMLIDHLWNAWWCHKTAPVSKEVFGNLHEIYRRVLNKFFSKNDFNNQKCQWWTMSGISRMIEAWRRPYSIFKVRGKQVAAHADLAWANGTTRYPFTGTYLWFGVWATAWFSSSPDAAIACYSSGNSSDKQRAIY